MALFIGVSIFIIVVFLVFKHEAKHAIIVDAKEAFLHDDYDPKKDKTLTE